LRRGPTSSTTSGYVPQWSSTPKTLGTGVPIGTTENCLLRLDSSARIPAVNASLVTGVTRQITVCISGGDSEITIGLKAIVPVDFNCTITKCTMISDQTGSITIDIWKKAYSSLPATDSDSITASATPVISSDIKYQDSTLTGWTNRLHPVMHFILMLIHAQQLQWRLSI